MKISYECEKLINLIVIDIYAQGYKEKCYLIKNKNEDFYSDYILPNKKIDNEDVEFKETSLFEALAIFISQNSLINRGETAYKLIAARNIAGLKQNEIAEKMNIDVKNYSKWETGYRRPKIDNLKKIAEICNIDITYLI